MQTIGGVTYFKYVRVALVSPAGGLAMRAEVGAVVTVTDPQTATTLVVLDPATLLPKTLTTDALGYVEEFLAISASVKLTAGAISIEVATIDVAQALRDLPAALAAAQAAQLSAAASAVAAQQALGSSLEVIQQNANGTWKTPVTSGAQRTRVWFLTVTGSRFVARDDTGLAGARLGELGFALAEPAP